MKAFSCFMCGHEFREHEQQYTVTSTPLNGDLEAVGRGRDVKVCKDCFLQLAADEEDDG